VETSRTTIQAGEVDMDVDMGALPTDKRRPGTVEVAASEISEGIGASLGRGPLFVVGGRWHESIDRREQALSFQLRQQELACDHSVVLPRQVEASTLQLVFEIEPHAR
jgi:hypothetical protein